MQKNLIYLGLIVGLLGLSITGPLIVNSTAKPTADISRLQYPNGSVNGVAFSPDYPLNETNNTIELWNFYYSKINANGLNSLTGKWFNNWDCIEFYPDYKGAASYKFEDSEKCLLMWVEFPEWGGNEAYEQFSHEVAHTLIYPTSNYWDDSLYYKPREDQAECVKDFINNNGINPYPICLNEDCSSTMEMDREFAPLVYEWRNAKVQEDYAFNYFSLVYTELIVKNGNRSSRELFDSIINEAKTLTIGDTNRNGKIEQDEMDALIAFAGTNTNYSDLARRRIMRAFGNETWNTTIPLMIGDNYISFPLEPINDSVMEMFDKIKDKINLSSSTRSYQNGSWLWYKPNDSKSTLTTISSKYGYIVPIIALVNLTYTGNVPKKNKTDLISGWNLAGYTGYTDLSIEQVLDRYYNYPTSQNITCVKYFLPDGVNSYTYPKGCSEGSIGSIDLLERGKGYWINASTLLECSKKGDKFPCDDKVDDFELLDYIDKWAHGLVEDFDLLTAIDNWTEG